MTRTRTIAALAAGALALAALAPTAAPVFAAAPAPAATAPRFCTVENGCRLIINPAFPGSPGTAAVPQRRTNRALNLNEILGDLSDTKFPIVQWSSRYTSVWSRKPLFRGFQSGSFDNTHMAVLVLAKCGDLQPPGGSGGGDWYNPIVIIGSGGGPFMKKKEVQVDMGPVCDGKEHVIVPASYWKVVDAGYGEAFRAPYFDVIFPVPETDMLITAEDVTWLRGITR